MASKSEWNIFFLDAKIPKDVAARYAVNFHKNRMSFEMLADLTKVHMYSIYVHVIPTCLIARFPQFRLVALT